MDGLQPTGTTSTGYTAGTFENQSINPWNPNNQSLGGGHEVPNTYSQPAQPPPNFIAVKAVNPFYRNFPNASSTSPTKSPNKTDSALGRVMRYNPSSVSPTSRSRSRRDGGYYKKTPRYCFPERPDLKSSPPNLINFIPAKGKTIMVEEENVPQDDKCIPGTVVNLQADSTPFVPTEMELELVAHKGKQPKKRALDISAGSEVLKKLKITPEKPATAVLNDLSPNLAFTYEDITESLVDPKFICRVTYPVGLDGKEYVGVGRSKKLSKLNVCELILRDLGVDISVSGDDKSIRSVGSNVEITESYKLPIPMLPIPFCQPNNFINPFFLPVQDFTQDEDVVMFSPEFRVNNLGPHSTQAIVTPSVQRLVNVPDIQNHSLGALNTFMGPESCIFEQISEDGPPHDKKFVVKLHLKTGLSFEGVGGSKKRAKNDAARQALLSLIGPQVYQALACSGSKAMQRNLQKMEVTQNNIISKIIPEVPHEFFNEDYAHASEYDITFSDYVARIVNEKYEEIMQDHQEHISQKVLAGIVMTRCNPMLENGEVIVVTTGTKCVEGDYMSTDGLAVNDCHAEILATRCLRNFLYSEVEDLACATNDQDREDSILNEIKSDTGEIFYVVKENVRFHLYISTSPCGDARIFSPKGLETDEEKEAVNDLEDSHPSKRNRGLLRAKVEAGEGTIPVANLITGPQTFDSIIQGNALYTMSCSDKVCRWNVVGLQGALLANLMFPVYYSSICLGSLHHPVHLRRAIIGRIESLAGKIPFPFKINRPQLLMVSHQEKRVVKKSPNHAVCWVNGWSTPEVLAASKGRCEPGGVASRLSKRMSFIKFLTLYKNQSGRRVGFVDLSYKEAKMMAEEYQKANEGFRVHMKETNCGSWISKPLEIDSFHIAK